MTPKTDVRAIADQILAMSPAARLRLAAGLLEQGKLDTARIIIDSVRAGLILMQLQGR